jgi:hypothetical protein
MPPAGVSPADLVVEQVEDALVEAEVAAQAEGDLRILPLQALDLRLDALDQHAGEQVYRNDANLHHAQPDLALHHVSRRGQVTPVKARSTSSCSLSSNIQRAILASSPLAPMSEEPRPSRMTPVVMRIGHGQLLHQAVELNL